MFDVRFWIVTKIKSVFNLQPMDTGKISGCGATGPILTGKSVMWGGERETEI
jgi:hypothetical protein